MPVLKRIFIFENPHKLANHLVKRWADLAFKTINIQKTFNVALSGGKTPVEFYCKLSALNDLTLWQNTRIFMTDERFVPYEHVDNNFKMIKESLLYYVRVPDENIFPINTQKENTKVSAIHYEGVLKAAFDLKWDGMPSFDLTLLGVGEDGHVAALFPQYASYNTLDRLVVPVSCDGVKHERVGFTFLIINNSENVFVIATGSRKAKILNKILIKKEYLPAAHLSPKNNVVDYFIDKEAARELPYLESYSDHDDHILMVIE